MFLVFCMQRVVCSTPGDPPPPFFVTAVMRCFKLACVFPFPSPPPPSLAWLVDWLGHREAEEMRPVEQDATLRIQCVFRGWAVRSRVAAKHSCALRIQTIMRMKLAGLRARRMYAAKVG
jgi:hypothetical protein